ncbi:MAG: hypothetical protein Q8N06_07055 [Hydrogenophaga sp.]|nr:hypothetical protein [Hydrogenophaga sp.]
MTSQTTVAIAGIVFNLIFLVVWFLRRPEKCVGCGTRLSQTGGFCQACGKPPSHAAQTPNIPTSPRLTQTRRVQLVALFALFTATSVGLLAVLPLSSRLQMGLGLALVLVAYVAILLVLRKAATCPTCENVTDGKYCVKCGHQIR